MKQLAIVFAAALAACQQAAPDTAAHQEQPPQVIQQQQGHTGLELAGAAVLGALAGGLLAQRVQPVPQPINTPIYMGRQVQEIHIPKPPASSAKPVAVAPVTVPKPAPAPAPAPAVAPKPAPSYAVKNQGYSSVKQSAPTYSRK